MHSLKTTKTEKKRLLPQKQAGKIENKKNIIHKSAAKQTEPRNIYKSNRQSELEKQNKELLKSREKLKNTLERFSDLYNFAPLGYLTLSENGEILEMNITCSRMLSITQDKSSSQIFSKYIFKEDLEKYTAFYKGLIETKKRQDCEVRLCSLTGEYIWVKLDSVPIEYDLNNTKVYLISIADITDQKNQYRLLELVQDITLRVNDADSLEKAFQICLDKICDFTGWEIGHAYIPDSTGVLHPTGIWHMKEPENFTTFRLATENSFFKSGEGIPGRVYESGEPAWIEDIKADMNFPRFKLSLDILSSEINITSALAFPVLEKKSVVAVLEFFSVKKQKQDVFLLKTVKSLATQLGRITERKRQEEIIKDIANEEKILVQAQEFALQLSSIEKYIQKTLKLLSTRIFWLQDIPEIAAFVNYRNEENNSLKLISAVTLNTRSSITCEKISSGQCMCGKTAESGCEIQAKSGNANFEFSEKCNINELWHYSIPIQDGRENLGVIVFHYFSNQNFSPAQRDFLHRITVTLSLGIKNRISELKLKGAKIDADHANFAKSEFLSRMSHELRTPLNAILGFDQLLQIGDQNLEKDQKDCVQQIQIAGTHLLNLINEVLDISAVDAGKIKLNMQTISLDEAVKSSIILSKPLAQKRNISLIPPEPCNFWITGDNQRLKQILINFISNAIKYNKQGGEVSFSTIQTGDGYVRFCVIDNGYGIKKENKELIFEPFQRLSDNKENIEGTGIGLTVSKKLIELMGGRLGFESEYDAGSTFWFELPFAKKNEDLSAVNLQAEISNTGVLNGKTILYIEDNHANMLFMKQIIAKMTTCTLLTASNAENGIQIALENTPDIILMDIDLPGMNGFDAYKILRNEARTSKIPVVALSSHAMQEQVEKGKNANFAEYLTKPLKIDKFFSTMEFVLSIP